MLWCKVQELRDFYVNRSARQPVLTALSRAKLKCMAASFPCARSKTTRRCSFCCTEVACHHYYSVWFDACFDGQSSGTVAVAIGAFLLVGIITAATTLMRIAVIAKDVTWAELLLHSHSASSSSAREEMALLQCTMLAFVEGQAGRTETGRIT
eukprot:6181025-Pleurochrysis_carterae.AAC.3